MCEQQYLPESSENKIYTGEVAGVPRDRTAQKESGKWATFKSLFRKKTKRGLDLAERAAVAEVCKKENEAKKILEEAANIAAETANVKAEEQLKKQKETVEFNKIIDDVFADNGQSIPAKKLKLAKLLENNPGIEAQISKINTILEKLSYERGAVFELRQEQKVLPQGDGLAEEVSDSE